MAKTIDENEKQVGIGYVHGSNRVTLPFRITPTGSLLMEIIPRAAGYSPIAFPQRDIPIDENGRQVGAAFTDAKAVPNFINPLICDEVRRFPVVRIHIT